MNSSDSFSEMSAPLFQPCPNNFQATSTASYEGSTTPPPLTGHPPAFTRMATVGNVPQAGESKDFDIVETYHRLLSDDPDLTMPVAAIEALIELLVQSRAVTVFETLDLVKTQSDYLKSRIPNSISLSAGTDLFQRYMISSLKPSSTGNFETVRQHLLSNGRLFVSRAKAGREKIANYGRHFVRDETVVLTHGGSRVVGALLGKAAEASASGGNVRFKVIYVMNDTRNSESKAVVSSLRQKGVPVATISEGAVGYAMGKVDLVIVGAEGCVENGGIISRLGTYQIALLAKAAGKPFYVAAESHKFVRLYPLGQYDLGIDQEVIKFKTEDEPDLTDAERSFANRTPTIEERSEYFETSPIALPKPNTAVDAVDFTPPALISALITESGVLTPSAVSEELISLWY
ncbi:Translation initiation factor eIF-2B subunit alpha [Lachnellula hyalina]|uniref:Translation initiation factor eIF2B subunit alpha n=1 Tax=Lachnellula hyalina TaxID=1316788 RepID=A0A8H8TXP8_9HELO|nr:Translation initiation factor eIF-2B subunit alpha [Lachnellula hyalina]TVY24550.1 Translation initiation factor eIF-2B subunit alpha [Lachnellula hyalina]